MVDDGGSAPGASELAKFQAKAKADHAITSFIAGGAWRRQ
jgi:hypothetical protein